MWPSSSGWGLLEAESESFSHNFTVLVISDISSDGLHFVSLHQCLSSFLDFVVVLNFLAELGFCCCSGFSVVAAKGGLLSGCGVQGSPWSGFSYHGARALEHMHSAVVAHRLSCPGARGSFPD